MVTKTETKKPNSKFLEEKESKDVKTKFGVDKSDKILKDYSDVISIIMHSEKGKGKSSLSYSFNGGNAQFAILDFDGTANNVIKLIVSDKKQNNYAIYNIASHIKKLKARNDKKIVTKNATKLYEYVIKLLTDTIPNINPNVLIFDGFQEWEWLCRMAMFNEKGIEFVANPAIGDWNIRNWNVDTSFAMAELATKDLVIYNMHQYDKPYLDIAGEYKGDKKKDMPKTRPEPQWVSDVKEKSHIILIPIKISSPTNVKYKVKIDSNKITGKEGLFDVTRSEAVKLWDILFKDKEEPFI